MVLGLKGGENGKKFLMDGPFAHYLGKGDHDKGLRLHLHHIWPRGKSIKLIRASPSIKLAQALEAC
jgi:hypothetical protein